MSKGDFGAICVLASMLTLIACIGVASSSPESSRNKCEKKGGIWYNPRGESGICIDKKMLINTTEAG